MIITDLVTLAKAGYTPAQVKEILSMQSSGSDNTLEEAAQTDPKEEAQQEQQNGEKTETAAAANEDKIADLMKQIEDLKKQLEFNKEQLEKAQADNASRDNSATQKQSIDEQVCDIVRGFM